MRRGYAEPDPREDLSGMDVARKALILGRLLGFCRRHRCGIGRVAGAETGARDAAAGIPRQRSTSFDDASGSTRVAAAKERGQVLRYVAAVTRAADPGRAWRRCRLESALGALRGTDNQVVFTTDRYRSNPLVITGPGAGLDVTAAGVMNDILKLAPA